MSNTRKICTINFHSYVNESNKIYITIKNDIILLMAAHLLSNADIHLSHKCFHFRSSLLPLLLSTKSTIRQTP